MSDAARVPETACSTAPKTAPKTAPASDAASELCKPYGCGLEAALDVIGGKWKVLILWGLGSGPLRFGELRRRIPGISEKMLIQNLKEMEHDGIVLRTDHREVPPRVDYEMTAFGLSLCEALAPLCAWGQQHVERIAACRRDDAAAPVAAPEKVAV